MKLLIRSAVLVVVAAVLMTGCSKKEEKAPAPKADENIAKKQTVVKVPEAIKGKWKAIVISAYDKKNAKEATYVIEIGSTLTLPESDFAIKAENFFPNFIMDGINLTSASNDLKNPATELKIYKGSKEIAKGWLFANYPPSVAFQKLDYTLKLINVIAAN
jgi:hypothetical protein